MGIFLDMLDSAVRNLVGERGFEDGVQGNAPANFHGRNRTLYFKSYHRGQRAAKVRLQNAMTKHLEHRKQLGTGNAVVRRNH